jgi:hypothetical protein
MIVAVRFSICKWFSTFIVGILVKFTYFLILLGRHINILINNGIRFLQRWLVVWFGYLRVLGFLSVHRRPSILTFEAGNLCWICRLKMDKLLIFYFLFLIFCRNRLLITLILRDFAYGWILDVFFYLLSLIFFNLWRCLTLGNV